MNGGRSMASLQPLEMVSTGSLIKGTSTKSAMVVGERPGAFRQFAIISKRAARNVIRNP